MNHDSFINECEKIKIKISEEKAKTFSNYYNEIIDYNEKVNLTSITKKEDVYIKHFLDSVLPINFFKKNSKIIDIGSGAGFPGIPIKIIRNDIRLTMIDSLNKRVFFLKNIINKFRLKESNAIHSRAEKIAHSKEHREQYDYCVSRAVAPLNILLEYCIPFIKVNGYFIAYKSIKTEEEVNQSKNAMMILGCEVYKIETHKIGPEDAERRLIYIKKTKKTDKKYPRDKNLPRKMPI